MAGFRIEGKDKARAKALASIAAAQQTFGDNLEMMIYAIDHFIKSKTPVNTGSAVRNYNWSVGTPDTSFNQPINNGDPGHTNSMALGSEPRRGPNEEAAARSLASLDLGNPFQKFILTNTDPDIGGLELGQLPGPPLSSRSPNGMFGLAEAFFNAKVKSQGML